jgi:FkbM family methyltransferase
MLDDGGTRIVDLGANVGLALVVLFQHLPHASAVVYEPDPDSAAVLQRTVADNGWNARVRIEASCAGARNATVQFAASASPLSRVIEENGASPDAGSLNLPMVDVLPTLAGADLVKMDIEGGEWEILEDPRFAHSPPRAIVLEYHEHETMSEAPLDRASRLLERAGMSVEVREQRTTHVARAGVVWAWRTATD